MRRYSSLVGVVVVAAFAALPLGYSSTSTTAFACPSDPRTQPLGKIYGKNRGTSFCNDGAKATAIVGTVKTKLSFTGGVCWKGSVGLNVAIGTLIPFERKAGEPPGFWLIDTKPGNILKDTVDAQRGTLTWNGPVKLKQSASKKTGTFTGREPKLVKGKLTYVAITGSYTCRRILDAPEQ